MNVNTAHDGAGAQAVYDLWLGLIPQFFGQFGVTLPPCEGAARARGSAPASTQGSTQMSDWMAQWSAAMSGFGAAAPTASESAAPSSAQSMFGTWAAMFAPYAATPSAADSTASSAAGTASQAGAGAMPGVFNPWAAALPFMPGALTGGTQAGTAAMQPFQAAQEAWLDFASRLSSGSAQSYMTGFDRTFGGLFDALGFGPMRKLQAGLQELAAASLTQNQSRAAYGMLVQGAFAAGLELLMKQLAGMADAGERVESVLTLLRMWAVNTEQAVHEVLQSERGLEATAAMTRAGLAHRKKLQNVAGIVADSLDMATRRELDLVYREIHELKREVRALRNTAAAAHPPQPAQAARARSTRRKTKS
ncbi:MAG: poly(R)-hydroxyalkanoic acid synthase subunit PhaE [Betaproteobacteria bacterium]